MALPESQWPRCARFLALGLGIEAQVVLTGTPAQQRQTIRVAINNGNLGSNAINRTINTIDPDGVPHVRGYRSNYLTRETYERMFGFDLITDLPNGL